MRNKENHESSVVVTETPPCAESIASTSKQRITKDKIGRKNTLSKRLNLRKEKIKLEGGIVSPQVNHNTFYLNSILTGLMHTVNKRNYSKS